jgi:hypothetical protein
MIAVYPGTVESIQVRVDHDCRYRSTVQVRSKINAHQNVQFVCGHDKSTRLYPRSTVLALQFWLVVLYSTSTIRVSLRVRHSVDNTHLVGACWHWFYLDIEPTRNS